MPMDLMVEASPRRIFANAHTYHINAISVNSDHETYLSADDLRINLWHLEITDRSFSILQPWERMTENTDCVCVVHTRVCANKEESACLCKCVSAHERQTKYTCVCVSVRERTSYCVCVCECV